MGDTGTSHESKPLDKPASPSDPTRARLGCLIDEIIADHGLDGVPEQRVGDVTRKEMLKLYDHPKVPQLEAILLKRITEEEARHILFFPDQDQAAFYQALIANPPKGAPEDHPQRALQIPHLSLLYLQHRKSWDFVSAFILSGGLHTLCSLFKHDHPVVRLKAITTLVSITAHEDFDWFRPVLRRRPAGPAAGVGGDNTTEARLHRALLGLRLDPSFISGLIANSWGGGSIAAGNKEEGRQTFPGGCLMCLELLAMWLSWVRALHTADGTLRLSRPLFRAIEEWAGKEGEREAHETGQPVPTLPDRKQLPRGDDAEDGGGATPRKREPGVVAPSTVGAATGGAPETAPQEPHAFEALNGAGEGRGEERKPETADKAAAAAAAADGGDTREGDGASTEGRPSADGLEAEEMMLEAEREERAKVLELVGRLVADFGRFPPAEQDWEGVEEGSKKGERDGQREEKSADEGRAAVGQACDGAPSSGETGAGAGGETGNTGKPTSGEKGPSTEGGGGGGGRGNDDGTAGGDEAHTRGPDESSHGDTPEALLSASTRKALALKVEGNESFGKGRVEEARDKYTDALGILDAAAGSAPSKSPARNETSEDSTSWEAATAEAAALRGVLHRNRAAVALRLFESKAAAAAATAAAAAKGEKPTAATKPFLPRKSSFSGDSSSDRREEDSAAGGPARGDDNGAPRTGQEALRQADEKAGARLALESSLALLEGCESDCLKAMEVDNGDKKARLRLDKCRDLRRRCYRGGLASAAAGKEGCSTVYSRQDERLQGRKADLVAKILARAEGSHELVGGASDGKVETSASSTPTPASTATASGDHASGDGGGALADAKAALPGVCGETGTNAGDDDPMNYGGGKGPSTTAGGADGRDAGPPGPARQDGARRLAPWEGGTLREDVVQNSTKVAGSDAAAEAAATGKKVPDDENDERGAAASRMAPKCVDSGEVALGGQGNPAKGGEKRAKKTAALRKKKKSDGGSAPRCRPAKADAAAVRSFRRRLENATARAAAVSVPAETEHGEEREARREASKGVWDVLMSLSLFGGGGGSLSLEKVLGDGITADSLVGITQGLRYACGINTARTGAGGPKEGGGDNWSENTQRASELFLELASVKRVGLASAMCSPEDRLALKDVADQIRRRQSIGASGGGSAEKASGEGPGVMKDSGEATRRRLVALDAAVSTLGLQS